MRNDASAEAKLREKADKIRARTEKRYTSCDLEREVKTTVFIMLFICLLPMVIAFGFGVKLGKSAGRFELLCAQHGGVVLQGGRCGTTSTNYIDVETKP